jgi:hypothetical protein
LVFRFGQEEDSVKDKLYEKVFEHYTMEWRITAIVESKIDEVIE